MDITGEIVLFARKLKTKDGKERTLVTTSISRKWEGENFSRSYSMDVNFSKNLLTEDQIAKLKEDVAYKYEVETGWLSLTKYTDKNGKDVIKPCVFIRTGKLLKATKVDLEKKQKALEESRARKQQTKQNEETPEIDPLDIQEEDLPF